MQAEWADRQVEREFTLPKGWFEVQLAADSKLSTAVRGSDGNPEDLLGGARWSYSRVWLKVHHGFSNRTRMYMEIPWVRARLHTADDETITTMALGDVHTGVWIQPWVKKRWATSLQVDLKSPSGLEWPSSFDSSPGNITSFLTGTGLTNLSLIVHGRLHLLDWLATELAVGYVFKMPAVVGYVIEQDGFGNGKLDAGDEFRVTSKTTVQVHNDVAVSLRGHFSHRGWYRMGVSGPDPGWEGAIDLLAPGYFLDVGGDVSWEPMPQFELSGALEAQVLGTDTRLFAPLGLEEFTPQPGMTASLSGTIRW